MINMPFCPDNKILDWFSGSFAPCLLSAISSHQHEGSICLPRRDIHTHNSSMTCDMSSVCAMTPCTPSAPLWSGSPDSSGSTKEWGWEEVFPARDISVDPRAAVTRRHHVDRSVINNAIKVAVRRAGQTKTISAHTCRHGLVNFMPVRRIMSQAGYDRLRSCTLGGGGEVCGSRRGVEAVPHRLPVGRSRPARPPRADVLGAGAIGGEAPRRVTGGRAALPPALSRAGRVRRMVRPGIPRARSARLHARPARARGRPIASQLRRDPHPRDYGPPCRRLRKHCCVAGVGREWPRGGRPDPRPAIRSGAGQAWSQTRPPGATWPRVWGGGAAMMGLVLPKCPAPCADGRIRHDDPTSAEACRHVAVAETASTREPDAMADIAAGKRGCLEQLMERGVMPQRRAPQMGTEQSPSTS